MYSSMDTMVSTCSDESILSSLYSFMMKIEWADTTVSSWLPSDEAVDDSVMKGTML